MLKLPKGLWIVVADGRKALFLENFSDTMDEDLHVLRKDELDNPMNRDQGAGKPGRRAGPGGASGMEHTDWHELAEQDFAGEVAGIVNTWAQVGAVKQVVLVAPPATLGTLRDKLAPATRKLVLAELPKDLTKHPVAEIAGTVKKTLADL
ncbi:host attachment protein [Thalassovita sp.]|uniref:host attachment protein n=1 Tax=Thalassovita sp. TaxID=1979401 RepID=UPI0029DE5408|nr:host attachment protein [Thalassovita sp.]